MVPLSIWNLEYLALESLHDGGDNAHRNTAHASQRTANIAHLIAATQEAPRRTLSSLGRTPPHAVLASLSPTWGSFRCAFPQVLKLRKLA